MELKIFNEPDESFFAIKNDPDKDEYNLEEGDHFILGYEIADDQERKQWVWSHGRLVKNDGLETPIAIDFNKMSEAFIKFEKLTYLPAWTYPSGRAFLAFESIKSDIPSDIKLSIIAGINPENNWHGVIISGYNSLVQLQSFLEIHDMKVNFEVVSR
jgi:hypothetical protein